MHNLAELYVSGEGVGQQPEMAYAWSALAVRYYSAADSLDVSPRRFRNTVSNEQRSANAQRIRDQLGRQLPPELLERANAFIEEFEPVSETESPLVPALARASEQLREEDVVAHGRLAMAYLEGDGVERDLTRARELLAPLAERGLAPARMIYARMLLNGQGGPVDLEEGARLVELAALGADLGSYALLGDLYREGRGVERNDAIAARYYLIAANNGAAQPQFLLGTMYAAGTGVEQDMEEAVKWYRLAADQGIPAAMQNLGAAYLNGNGVETDRAMAFAWFQLALRHYPQNSPNRETLEGLRAQMEARLPQEDKDRANRFVASWSPGSGE
jgi:TPR repeat protein